MIKYQIKKFEKAMFKYIAKQGNYDVLTEEFYSYIHDILKRNKIFFKGRVLEAGCGSGAFGKRFLEYFPDIFITGVDLCEDMVKLVNNSHVKGYTAVVGDLENPKLFDKKSFDQIISPFLLHHFPDISLVAKNFKKWIKRNSFLILIEPNGSNIINKFSNILRNIVELFLGRNYIIKNRLASPNEINHSIKLYNKIFSQIGFKLIAIDSFLIIPEDFCMRSIFDIKIILYKIFRKILPRSLLSGSDIVIIYKSE